MQIEINITALCRLAIGENVPKKLLSFGHHTKYIYLQGILDQKYSIVLRIDGPIDLSENKTPTPMPSSPNVLQYLVDCPTLSPIEIIKTGYNRITQTRETQPGVIEPGKESCYRFQFGCFKMAGGAEC